MTVAELIVLLSKMPQNAEVTMRFVGEYNYDDEILSVDLINDKKWSWHDGGHYIDMAPKVVLH